MKMSHADNQTFELWKSFMPRRKEIRNSIGTDLFSMQVYSPTYDPTKFNPNEVFEKWAAMEVTDFNSIPDEMEAVTLIGGLYVVFLYQGPANSGYKVFQYIFESWMPNSKYLLDNRPHFEILGEKYKNDDPDSEEEIWIPINKKGDRIV